MFSVIFDMDGTLTDTQSVCIRAWDYAGELQGFKNAGESIPHVLGMNKDGWEAYLAAHYEGIDLLAFDKAMREYIINSGTPELKKGAKEILEFLKQNGVRMAVASGSAKYEIDWKLGETGILHYFKAFAGGDDVELCKPAPDVFLLAAERLGADPKDCFVFEDSSLGIKAGHTAGMKCIGVADVVPFTDEAKSLMFKELNSLEEAIPILKEYL
ncbi:MAG: HAD family phosphatase [Clostridia bacterium]|nr:HAD family phosphatase [Clostridia bacterium]